MNLKKFLLISITLLFFVNTIVLANNLTIENNLITALSKAKKQNKLVLMMYSAEWCPECEYMKEVVFKDSKVNKYLQKNYIILILDVQKDKLPKGFTHVGIPVFFIIDRNGKELHKIIGGSKADKFLKKLKGLK